MDGITTMEEGMPRNRFIVVPVEKKEASGSVDEKGGRLNDKMMRKRMRKKEKEKERRKVKKKHTEVIEKEKKLVYIDCIVDVFSGKEMR